MTKAEAERRVYGMSAVLLAEIKNDAWLFEDDDGAALSDADEKTMRDAFDKILANLEERGRRAESG